MAKMDAMIRLPDSFFVTGNDTGVGKTYIAARIVQERRNRGADCVGMKPICCGGREDAEMLYAASGEAVELNEINPLWLRTPAAPYVAAMVEARPLDLSTLFEACERLRSAHAQVVVEGVGGWRVPITRDFFVSDLAVKLGLPVVVVVANRLGALNHTILTVESIEASGMECAGVILNHVQPRFDDPDVAEMTNAVALQELLSVPILAEWPYGGALPLSR